MSSRVFAPKSSIPRVRKPAERIYAISSTPPRVVRSPSPAVIRAQNQQQKHGPTPCKNCGSTETEEGDGNIVCKVCGLVLSNAPNYTSDITFEEGSNGRIQQQGQRVADGQTHQKAFTPRGLGGGPGHEATPAGERAKTEATNVIRRFAMLLRIDEREVNMGRRIFEMAYNRGFVRGRTIDSVAIVSLYIATRRAKDRKPLYDIMLIDLAEQANINVFDLGKMMQDLIKNLYLNPDGTMNKDDHFYLQAHGAEVLIDKFVNHLDFGADANKIRNDATRILQRMKRDWLHHGRRPSGVCGAAVILAARMNNYRRTLREVVLVAKVTEITVSKRLDEFKETESSGLSVSDFRDDDILASLKEMDPPSYYQALQGPKKKGKRGRKRKNKLPVTAAEIEGSDTASQADSTNDQDEQNDQEPPSKRPRVDADGFVVPELPVRSSQPPPLSQENIDPALRQTIPASTPESDPGRRGPGRVKGSKVWRAPPPTEAELVYEAELTESMQEALDQNQDLDPARILPTPPATQISASASDSTEDPERTEQEQVQSTLPLRVDPAECDPKKDPPGPAVNSNTGNTGYVSLDPDLSDTEFDDDPEVSTCLLSEPERRLKEKIWVTENAEWLRQDHAKRIKRELKDRHLREMGIDPDEQRKAKKGEMKKRKDGARRSGRIGDVGYLKDDFHKKTVEDAEGTDAVASSHDETGRRPSAASLNVKAMMKQRGTYSRRINYDNLVKAYDYPTGGSTSPSRSRSRSPSRDRNVSREDSVISVSSTSSEVAAHRSSSKARDTIGPIFRDPVRRRKGASKPRARVPSQATSRATRDTLSNSPAAEGTEGSTSPGVEETPGRRRTGSAASPEPQSSQPHNSTTAQERPDQDKDDGANDDEVEIVGSSSASPLSSTHTPLGVSTPGSSGTGPAPTRIDRSMYGDLGRSGVHAQKKNDGGDDDNDDDENDEDEDEDDQDEEEDDEEDEDDEHDPDNDLSDAFAGNFRERPVWEGEDEVVED